MQSHLSSQTFESIALYPRLARANLNSDVKTVLYSIRGEVADGSEGNLPVSVRRYFTKPNAT